MRVRRRRRRNLTRVYILAVILVVIVTGVVAANWFGSQEVAENIETQSGIQKSDNYLHIMVMGVDRRNDDVGRSDTLMAVTVNKDAGTAQICPCLEIPEYRLRAMVTTRLIMLMPMAVTS